VRALLAPNVEVAASVGYLSFFVSDLNVYEARTFISLLW
jgi:hypothetical protein